MAFEIKQDIAFFWSIFDFFFVVLPKPVEKVRASSQFLL